ncbi:MAG: hypothetical protein ACI92Z_001480 [Paracoccaceae bacterium]|jgi:hypothetical protein
MHAYDIMLIVSIACVVGFIGVIYVDDDLALAFWYVPIHDQFAVVFGAFGGGVLLAVLTRMARWQWPRP